MDKKETKGQLERRIKNAIVFVPKDKDTKTIFFSDKGLRLTVTSETAVIATNFHSHVFNSYTTDGLSRPYLYTKRLIEIANENDCETPNGYSFGVLLSKLKEKEDKAEYNLATYISWWLFNIFQPLYGIGESEVESLLVYEDYIHNVARTSIFLSEKTEDMTNKQYITEVLNSVREFSNNIEEHVIFPKKTDEEIMQENIDAIKEQEIEDYTENDTTNQETQRAGDNAN